MMIVIFCLAGCAGAPPRPDATLYDRLGGADAIRAVVEELSLRVAGDKRINKLFWNADLPHLREMLCEQICEAAGGPCRYTGKSMKTAHAGMNLGDDDFAALVEDLIGALDKLGVPRAEKRELLSALAALKPDVLHQ